MSSQYFQERFLNGFRPKGVSVIIRMCAVHRCRMFLIRGICLYEIHTLILPAGLLHQSCSSLLLLLLPSHILAVKVASFPVDGLLKDKRYIRMGTSYLLYKREKPLLNDLCRRIRECIEDKSINVRIPDSKTEGRYFASSAWDNSFPRGSRIFPV